MCNSLFDIPVTSPPSSEIGEGIGPVISPWSPQGWSIGPPTPYYHVARPLRFSPVPLEQSLWFRRFFYPPPPLCRPPQESIHFPFRFSLHCSLHHKGLSISLFFTALLLPSDVLAHHCPSPRWHDIFRSLSPPRVSEGSKPKTSCPLWLVSQLFKFGNHRPVQRTFHLLQFFWRPSLHTSPPCFFFQLSSHGAFFAADRFFFPA